MLEDQSCRARYGDLSNWRQIRKADRGSRPAARGNRCRARYRCHWGCTAARCGHAAARENRNTRVGIGTCSTPVLANADCGTVPAPRWAPLITVGLGQVPPRSPPAVPPDTRQAKEFQALLTLPRQAPFAGSAVSASPHSVVPVPRSGSISWLPLNRWSTAARNSTEPPRPVGRNWGIRIGGQRQRMCTSLALSFSFRRRCHEMAPPGSSASIPR